MRDKIDIIIHYFHFQLRRMNRGLKDFGIYPNLAYFLLIFAFIGLSYLLFKRTEYAAYIYTAVAILYMLKLDDPNKSRFLKNIYSRDDFYLLRYTERLFVALPFVFFLLFKNYVLISFTLLLFSFLFAFQMRSDIKFRMPSPFGKYPYEFAIGFRKYYWLLFLLITVYFIGLFVDNFNLALVCLLFIHFVFITFYSELEPKFYTWIHNFSPSKFLLYKVGIAFVYSILSTFIFLLILIYRYPDSYILSIGLYFLSLAYLFLYILMTYASLPNGISFPTALIFLGSMIFPPLLLFLFPWYYRKSIYKLNPILT